MTESNPRAGMQAKPSAITVQHSRPAAIETKGGAPRLW